MFQLQYIEQERRLATQLSAKFRGTASVSAGVLDFPSDYPAKEDDKYPERMKKVFREAQNAKEWEIFNHIPATIEPEQLDNALVRAGITSEQLLHARGGDLQLDFPEGIRLNCLRGRH